MATSKRRNKVPQPADGRQAKQPSHPEVVHASTSPDLAHEYAYVRKDIRKLVIVSVVIFVVMFGVGYFI